VYEDRTGTLRAEVIEIKPSKETNIVKAGKSVRNQAMAIINQAKWQAADIWCKNQKIIFRVITENEMFANGKR
jgi:hypothetical protein